MKPNSLPPSTISHTSRYAICGCKPIEINTDPQNRCYDGCHFSSEWVWTDWVYLGSTLSREEAESSVASCKRLNPKNEYRYLEPHSQKDEHA